MFEVQDLAVASPATVSRCGMVYLEPSILGLNPFVKCWMQKLPDCIFDHRETLNALFDNFLEVCSSGLKAQTNCIFFVLVFQSFIFYFYLPRYIPILNW